MTESVVDTAINVTICGLAIVFGTLILLVIVISLFGLIMKGVNGAGAKGKAAKAAKAAQGKAPAAPAAKAPAAVQSSVPNTPASNEDELIAVISAAVAATYAGSGKTFAVRNIRPAAPGARSVWAAAGVARNTRAF